MSTLKNLVKDAKVDKLHSVVESGGQKYLVFTRLLSDCLVICVSDGYDLWRLEVGEDDLEAFKDLTEVTTSEAYLTRLRAGFQSGDINISQIGVKVNLCIGQGNKSLTFELYEAKAVEKRTELQNILFRLSEHATELDNQLKDANKTIDSLKAQKGAANSSGLFDLGSPKKKQAPKTQAKRVGMSAINPASKRRKAAKGVQFD